MGQRSNIYSTSGATDSAFYLLIRNDASIPTLKFCQCTLVVADLDNVIAEAAACESECGSPMLANRRRCFRIRFTECLVGF